MRKTTIVMLGLFLLFFITGCKADTIEEGMKKANIDYVDISYVLPIGEGAAVFYRAKTDLPNQFPLGIALFKGNDKEGWEHINHGWSHYNNENLIIETEFINGLFAENDKPKMLTFGVINNPYIHKILVLDSDTQEWNEATIQRKNDFFFYYLGHYNGIKALSEQGHVIDIQATGDKEMQDLSAREHLAHNYLHEALKDNGIEHYYLGTIDHFLIDNADFKKREEFWKLAKINPSKYEGQNLFIEKYKVELYHLEEKLKGGTSYAYILVVGDKAVSGYLSVESNQSNIYFDFQQNQIVN